MSLTLHLLRHGATRVETPWRFLGQRDLPLSAEGRAQAGAWRSALSATPFSHAICSDLSRCRETAAIVLDGRAVQAKPLPALREIDLGAFDGLSREEVAARFPGLYEARGRDMADFRPPGGESFADLAARTVLAVERLAANASGDVLAVTHAGVIRVLLCRALGMPLENLFRLDVALCGLTILRWGDGNPRLVHFNLRAKTEDQARRA